MAQRGPELNIFARRRRHFPGRVLRSRQLLILPYVDDRKTKSHIADLNRTRYVAICRHAGCIRTWRGVATRPRHVVGGRSRGPFRAACGIGLGGLGLEAEQSALSWRALAALIKVKTRQHHAFNQLQEPIR